MTATSEQKTATTEYVDLQDSSILRLRTHGPIDAFTGRQLGVLLLITLVAGFLRLYDLGSWSLWVDEAHTYRDATLPLRGENGFFSQYRSWYPSSFLMLRALLDSGLLAGISEGWLRLPFAFCGIVTVPALALVGNLFVGRRAALFAAALLALNPWHIFWSQNARGYVMVFFFATLAAGAFWLGSVRRHWGWLLTGVLTAVVGGTFHPTCFLLLAPFLVHPLLARVEDFGSRRFWIAVAVGLLLLAGLPFVVQHLPPFAGFLRAKPDASLSHFVQTTAFYFRVPLMVTALIGVWVLFAAPMQGRVLFLACWFLVPLLVLSVLSFSVVKATARYAFCALPAVLLLASAAAIRLGDALADGLGGRARGRRWLPLAVLPTILCMDMAAYDYLYFRTQHGDRAQWRQAGETILRASAGKPVQVMALPAPSLQYYLRPDHWRKPGSTQLDPHPERQVVPVNSWDVFAERDRKEASEFYGGRGYVRRSIASARDAGRELWFAVMLPELQEIDRDGSLHASLNELLELVTVLPCQVGPKDESIWLWRVRDPARGTKVGATERNPAGDARVAAKPGPGAPPSPAGTGPKSTPPKATPPKSASPTPTTPRPAPAKAGVDPKDAKKVDAKDAKKIDPKDAGASKSQPAAPKPASTAKPPDDKHRSDKSAVKPASSGKPVATDQRRTGGTGS